MASAVAAAYSCLLNRKIGLTEAETNNEWSFTTTVPYMNYTWTSLLLSAIFNYVIGIAQSI